MNLVDRLNARFNNVIHDGLALVGAVVDPWLAKLERQAMSNALGRDFGLDYADGLAAAEAEEEVHEPGFASVRGNAGGGCDEAEEAELLDEFMELGEFLDSATAEELAAMRQQHAAAAELERHLRYFTTAPGASGVNPGVVAQSLLEIYRITPK
ncbi:hypothetical protein SEA_DAWORST_55 [Mycobacterium phage DaWorst]|nr:hypothetical protein SEA_DAWORST_55 [Mycobacterium phage DaWorst]